MVVRLLLFAFLVGVYGEVTKVEYLPGYRNGTEPLPFKLETGYIGVDTDKSVQLFYYFVESQGSEPTKDPILLWITGGPGCSSIRAFFLENGPLVIHNSTSDDESTPTLYDNPNTWTTNLSIIYLDGPVGTGFSYSKTPQGYVSGDFIFANRTVEFLKKWVDAHPNFSESKIFLGGDGYTGNTIPIMLQNLLLDRSKPSLNIKGYVLGNPGTDFNIDFNSRIPFSHRMGFIPDKLFDEATKNCNGDYINPPSCDSDCDVEPIPPECAFNCSMTAINKLIDNINGENVLESNCRNVSEVVMISDESNLPPRRSLHLPYDIVPLPLPTKWCRKNYHRLIVIWAQNPEVQKALGVRNGTKPSWESCNDTIMYSKNVSSVVAYHQNLTNYDISGLIYSGDHDLGTPSIGTQTWIWRLNLTLTDHWRAWSVDDETVGFTRKFAKDVFDLTYATVRGAGHFSPENKPHVCSEMIKRWIASETL